MNFIKENLKFLVCPVCKEKLDIEIIKDRGNEIVSGNLKCRFCQKDFEIIDGIPNLIPDLFSKNKKYKEWEKKQKHGLEDYENSDKNYQNFIKLTAKMFGTFCQHRGTVLDIGCGIAPELNYFNKEFSKNVNFIGIDPLRGKSSRNYFFVQGIGEYLPFCTESIDQVIISTTLDHIIDPLPLLKEAKRVVKKEGEINIWISIFDPPFQRRINLIKKLFASRTDFKKIIGGVKSKINEEITLNSGDNFHFDRFTRKQIFLLINQLEMEISRSIILDERFKNLFLKIKKI